MSTGVAVFAFVLHTLHTCFCLTCIPHVFFALGDSVEKVTTNDETMYLQRHVTNVYHHFNCEFTPRSTIYYLYVFSRHNDISLCSKNTSSLWLISFFKLGLVTQIWQGFVLDPRLIHIQIITFYKARLTMVVGVGQLVEMCVQVSYGFGHMACAFQQFLGVCIKRLYTNYKTTSHDYLIIGILQNRSLQKRWK